MNRVRLAFAGACLTGVTAVGSASAEAVVSSKGGSSSIDTSYAVYYAAQDSSGYRIYGVNGTQVPCGEGVLAHSCSVSSISFSPLNLSAATSNSILADVGASSSSAQLLFEGQVTGGVLNVWQAWRSPVLTPMSDTFYAVSHADEQTLLVNEWTTAALGTLDFSAAPANSNDDPSVEVTTTPGILLAGVPERGGEFRVEEYFIDIGFGLTQSGDGYSYCDATQLVCSSGKCGQVNDCAGVVNRIKGMSERPTLPSDPTYQAWELATGQLVPSDISTDDAGE